MGTKSILIIDDHPLFREGLKAIIDRDNRYDVVGESGKGDTGLQLAKELKPDIVVVDISLPDISGIQLIRKILIYAPETRILIVSMHSKIDYIVAAFKAGAIGYIIKESASEKLLQGLQSLAHGEYFLDSSVSYRVVKNFLESSEEETKVTDIAYCGLTPREQEVMSLLAEGLSKKEIATKFYICQKTVENHRASIMKKLGLHTPIELVRYAVRLGLIDMNI